MAQILSGRSEPVPIVPPVPVPVRVGRYRPVPIVAGAADRPQETLYAKFSKKSTYKICFKKVFIFLLLL